MVKISVLYPNQPGVRFDEQYYMTSHMALVGRLLGPVLKGAGVDKGMATPEGPAPYLFIAHLCFESMEAMQSAMDAHGAVLMADIPNYTDIQPVIQVSDVVIAQQAATQGAG
jgi:uncharacterized protein (TIGR02118 family)